MPKTRSSKERGQNTPGGGTKQHGKSQKDFFSRGIFYATYDIVKPLYNAQNSILYNKQRFRAQKEWSMQRDDSIFQCVHFEEIIPLQQKGITVLVFNYYIADNYPENKDPRVLMRHVTNDLLAVQAHGNSWRGTFLIATYGSNRNAEWEQ